MLKTCQGCGIEYEGAAQSKFHSPACRMAFVRRGEVEQDEEVARPEVAQVGLEVAQEREVAQARSRPTLVRELIDEARAGIIVLTPAEEQAIRDFMGYTSSEKRTLAERDRAAATIRAATKSQAPTVTRQTPDGRAVEEPVGPAGLSLVAFPTQTAGDLIPSPDALKKLGLALG